MRFSSAAVSAFLLSAAGMAAAFAPASPAFVVSKSSVASSTSSVPSTQHVAGCICASCLRRARATAIFSTAEEATETEASAEAEAEGDDAEVPAEVEALDGIKSDEELHNAERPARKSLKKKGPRGKPLSDYSVGETVTAKVKTVTSYGAFLDIGAQTDGLLHISQLSTEYVSDVKSVIDVGEEVKVRIMSIDEKKGQVALSLLTEEQEEEAKEAAAQSRQQQRGGGGGGRQQRRDDSAVLAQLTEKGWSADQFVEGTVVSTVDFGAFVRVDASLLNSEVEGELDGLVHISALTKGRADSVTSVVNVNDKVQVRVKGIENRKVSLSMISVEDEQAAAEARGSGGGGGSGGGFGARDGPQGNREWRKDLEEIKTKMPKFENKPLVVDNRG